MALFEQDFLMRQIQYLTQLLQQIIFKKKNNQQDEAVYLIEDAFQRLTKDHPKEFNELTLEETLDLFTRNDTFEAELALAAADLLVEEGSLLYESAFSKSEKCFTQALLLYQKALTTKDASVPMDIKEKIAELEKKVRGNRKDKLNEILN